MLEAYGANEDIGRAVIAGMKADRQAMFGGQMLRALGFAILLLGTLYLYLRNLIKPIIVSIVLILVSTVELTMVSKAYLNEEDGHYVSADSYTSNNFTPTAIDQQILKDTAETKTSGCLTWAGDTYNESRTSYFHKSVGGYHPAKLRIYQDVIEKYLANRPQSRSPEYAEH